jgi:phenylacetate-CoA ligase
MLDQLYSTLFRGAIFPMMEGRLRGRATASLLQFLDESQWRPFDELVAFQEGEMRRLLRHAQRNVPFYAKTFAARGVDARTILSVADLHRLPVLTRTEAYQFAAARKSTAGPAVDIETATGGTTGEPLKFGYERSSEYWRQAMKWRGYGWAGYRPGDTTLHYWGASTAATSRRKALKIAADRAFRREHYFDCHHRSEEEMRGVVAAIVRLRPRVLVCYTSAGVDLARFINERGLRQWDALRVVCGAERLLPQHRPAMEAAFGHVVFETYGSREVMLMGAECEAHDGLHQTMENVIVEIVVRDGDSTRPAKAGERGEVLITDLHNFAMPFIRYANGDLAVEGPDERCRCGRTLRRFGPVEGRVAETLTDGDGAKVNGLVFNVVFTNYANIVKQFQAIQHVDKSVTLKVVLARALTDAEYADIRKHLEKYLPNTRLTIQPVDEIPPGKNGKRRVAIVE